MTPVQLFSFATLVFGSAGFLAPGAARSESVRVLDHIVIAETKVQGEKIGEFSALVAAPDDNGLIAVSDRGYLARLAVTISGDALAAVEVVSVHVLTGPDGGELRDENFSPEAAAILPDGMLAIVDEAEAKLKVFDTQGVWLRDELLPEGLRDTALQASEKDGVEALAWTEATGFIAMTEEPHLGQPRNLHSAHSSLAGVWAIAAEGTESVSIKGMEISDGRLLVLERTRHDVTDALTPFLRILDPVVCAAAQGCTGTTHPIAVESLTDADFEGIAALGGGRFLIVSDDKIDGDLRSVFVLLAID
jgi:uncharacterized protein YjiK